MVSVVSPAFLPFPQRERVQAAGRECVRRRRRGPRPPARGDPGAGGESGSGKSTTLFELLELAAPEGGSVELFGQRLGSLRKAEVKARRRWVQIVFQDPMASLDPRMPVGDIIAEPLRTQDFRPGHRRPARPRTAHPGRARPGARTERRRTRILLAGDPPSPTRRYHGCRFRARCPLYASLAEEERKRCAHDVPVLDGDGAACHFPRVREVI
ncbi:ATP-binding cassette domain-containing protein [Streptomyces avermitilis]|uniref:ATP-binding cassette domain-containing protein n=1 Tax=Streptomyces avermitilis TaxID=33903 RepID=UPI0033FBF706